MTRVTQSRNEAEAEKMETKKTEAKQAATRTRKAEVRRAEAGRIEARQAEARRTEVKKAETKKTETRQDREPSRRQNNRHKLAYYVTEVTVIAAVVATALLLPQLIFQVQDNILCSGIKLGQRESMNLDALSTTYEKSLAVRMRNFAEGLAQNKSYYVTMQELSPNEELEEFLYSDKGLYQDIIEEFANENLIPHEVWSMDEYTVTQWKQYVIYNDDYEEGVNFILWYIELQDIEGGVFKLLTDAEDNTVYGLRSEDSSRYWNAYWWRDELYGDRAIELWGGFAWYYQSLTQETIEVLTLMEEQELDWATLQQRGDSAVLQKEFDAMGIDVDAESFQEPAEQVLRQSFRYELENGNPNSARFTLPFGEATLDAVFSVENLSRGRDESVFPDFTVGIIQIYEMIPEFA